MIRTPRPLREAIRPTAFLEPEALRTRLGLDLTLVSEAGQHTGSFKFRAAYNVASSVPHSMVITASSGNFGQAMAYACQLLGKRCLVVMPDNSARVKVEAVKRYGGQVDMIDVRQKPRAERVAELAAEHPEAYVASSYDDPLVIEGNATLGAEIAESGRGFDMVVVPVGGGGVSAGVVQGLKQAGSPIRVVGAEPLVANDAARSLREGRIVAHAVEPQTIADGARTVSLGRHNWEILKSGLSALVEVPEEKIAEGLRLLAETACLRVEPTGALALGAVLTEPERFRGRKVAVIVSGSNVDDEVYQRILNP